MFLQRSEIFFFRIKTNAVAACLTGQFLLRCRRRKIHLTIDLFLHILVQFNRVLNE